MPLLLLLGLLFLAPRAFSLPIGFGFHQRDIRYECLQTPKLRVYYDARVPHEGVMIANAIEAEMGVLEEWLATKRTSLLPVISSAVTANASFANFVTDAIELQTLGYGDRDLYWHETVHIMSYQYFHNILGPAGSILHLAWLPAWFLEGLAEALSVSVGSDTQASIERYHALSGNWPSYDRLHSLYKTSTFFLEGYATSGAFVRWILAQKQQNFLPELLQDFYEYTLPQYWLTTLYPLRSYMPLDQALRKHIGLSGAEAYEKYKKEAEAYWKNHRQGEFFAGQAEAPRLLFDYLDGVQSDGESIFAYREDGGFRRKHQMIFSKDGWGVFWQPTSELSEKKIAIYENSPEAKFGLKAEQSADDQSIRTEVFKLTSSSKEGAVIFSKESKVADIPTEVIFFSASVDGFLWQERDFETSRLCHQSHSKRNCLFEKTLTDMTQVIGIERPLGKKVASKVWLDVKSQSLGGDRHQVFVYDALEASVKEISYKQGGVPLALAQAGDDLWLLVGAANRRSLKKIDRKGSCLSEIFLDDYITKIFGLGDGSLVLGINEGQSYSLKKIDPKAQKQSSCKVSRNLNSPILWAMNHPGVSLPEALKRSSIWSEYEAIENETILANKRLSDADPNVPTTLISPAPWKPRPILTIPWIGADDALGPQFGVVSVPLMDEMQNETLRLSILYGPNSHYPNTEITLESDRYWPSLGLSLYRRQLWDGLVLYDNNRRAAYTYLDEVGMRAVASFSKRIDSDGLWTTLALRLSDRKYFFGPKTSRAIEGFLFEPSLALGWLHYWPRWTLDSSTAIRGAHPSISPKFSYNVFEVNTSLTWAPQAIDASQIAAGIEYSQTRGENQKTPNLRETYQALKTFVPGSGGGYNMNSFNLFGDDSLFAVWFGDTYVRSRLTGTLPVIKNLEKQVWLFYFDSINFSAFYNYGGTYWHKTQTFADRAISAHGESLSLLLENKGVSFSASLGTGQIVGKGWQLYTTFGFDAFF